MIFNFRQRDETIEALERQLEDQSVSRDTVRSPDVSDPDSPGNMLQNLPREYLLECD